MDDQSLPPHVIKYRPQTQATQTTFNSILAFVAKKLADVFQEAVYNLATEGLLKQLKDEGLTDFEKKQEIDMFETCLRSKEFDCPQDIVHSVTDATIELLKAEEDLEDFEKKELIDDMLGTSLSSEEFNELLDLGEKITDYVYVT